MAKGQSLAKERLTTRVRRPNGSAQATGGVALIQATAQIFSRLIENFGWPGALLVVGWASINLWATDEQKHSIIDLYVLGQGIAGKWPLVIASIVFVLTLFAQRSFYLRKIRVLNEELAREGREKSILQVQLSRMDLQHAETRTPGGH